MEANGETAKTATTRKTLPTEESACGSQETPRPHPALARAGARWRPLLGIWSSVAALAGVGGPRPRAAVRLAAVGYQQRPCARSHVLRDGRFLSRTRDFRRESSGRESSGGLRNRPLQSPAERKRPRHSELD